MDAAVEEYAAKSGAVADKILAANEMKTKTIQALYDALVERIEKLYAEYGTKD